MSGTIRQQSTITIAGDTVVELPEITRDLAVKILPLEPGTP